MSEIVGLTDQAAVPQSRAMSAVYGWMTAGLALTGLVSYVTLQSSTLLRFINDNVLVFWGVLVIELILVFVLAGALNRLSTAAATGLFLLYAALNGFTLAGILQFYTGASIASTFFITAGTFAIMSLYGATTKRDLTTVGNLALMGLIGLILASLVNIFFQSTTVYWILTFAGVLIFVALTARDTQRIQALLAQTGGAGNVAILGALTLYLDFINLFLYLLRIFGQARDD